MQRAVEPSSKSDSPRGLLGSLLWLAVAAGAVGALAGGCGGIGDEEYTGDTRAPVNLDDLRNAPFCVRTCQPDYGSQQIDCSAEDGLEFFPGGDAAPIDIFNFNGGTAAELYAYNDGTSNYMVAGPVAQTTGPAGERVPVISQSGFAPPSTVVNDRCEPNEEVLHLRGGPFREWGGGMGRRLLNFASAGGCPAGASRDGDPQFCPDADQRIEAAAAEVGENGQLLNAGLPANFYGMTADLSEWEGISFWGRQGPDSQGGLRVYIGDRQLDEDIAFLETEAGLAPLCKRQKECGCRNHRLCTPNDAPLIGSSCWDPERDESPASIRQRFQESGQLNLFVLDDIYEACGETACNEENPAFTAIDTVFATAAVGGTASCLPYKMTNDLEDMFCYDPAGDPEFLPPDGPERCGDGWAQGVTLSTDWQLFQIPFTELRQEGWGKEFQYLDLSKITLVRFTWPQGWIDVWLDDVRFYRHRGFVPPGSSRPGNGE